MRSLNEALENGNLTPIADSAPQENKPSPQDQRIDSLLSNAYKRCPLPPTNNSADAIRQWGQGSDVPRFRTLSPASNQTTSTQTVTEEVVASTTPSSGGSTVVVSPTAENVGTTTPALTPGQNYTLTIQMAKAFLLLSATANAACRIRMYGSSAARMLDIGRPVTQAPLNSAQGVLSDIVLTSATSWNYLNTTGANQDSTQNSTVYVTITNMTGIVTAFTVSWLFLQMET